MAERGLEFRRFQVAAWGKRGGGSGGRGWGAGVRGGRGRQSRGSRAEAGCVPREVGAQEAFSLFVSHPCRHVVGAGRGRRYGTGPVIGPEERKKVPVRGRRGGGNGPRGRGQQG